MYTIFILNFIDVYMFLWCVYVCAHVCEAREIIDLLLACFYTLSFSRKPHIKEGGEKLVCRKL